MCICRKSAVSASIDNCAPASRRRTSITTLSFAKKAGVAFDRRLSALLKASTFAVLMISTSASKTLWRSSKQGILRSSMSEPNGKLAAKLGILNLIGVSHSRAGEARRRRQYNEYGKGAEASPLQMRANQRMLQSMRQSLENASLQSYKTQFLEHPECKVHVFHKNFHRNQVLEALNRKLKSNQINRMPSILHKTSSISHLAWSNSFARRGSVWPFSISTSPCATRLSFVLNRNCREDEGRSLGIALQEGIPNHLKRLRTKSSVVSVKEKALLKASGVD